jgi:formylmethanofuran dehydrogenase subunit B
MSRKLIVVDPRVTDTAKMADMHLQVEQGKDYELTKVAKTKNP